MRVLTLVLALVLGLPTLPARAEVPRVQTDISPVAALVAQVMGDLGRPGLLLDKGGDEHDMQLRPSQRRDLAAATLLIWVGPELTPGLDQARAAAQVQSLALLDDPRTLRQDYAEGGLNPHAWLDPANAAIWIDLIAACLQALDPDHAATYRANAAAAQARIVTLDAALAAKLAPLKRPFVTYHDAYGYFARHYNLPYRGGLAAGDAAPPGAAQIARLHQDAASGAIRCAFPEAQHDPALIDSLAEGTGLFVGPPLDPVGSMLDPGPDAYDLLLTGLATALLACATADMP
ncbi:zinc ABC transporter substrate-binding protein [bacterium]|nr:zinc ABC transporter substrate-binding protein [bacterium]